MLIVAGIAVCLYGISLPFHPASSQKEYNQSIIDEGVPSPGIIKSVKKTMGVNSESSSQEPTLMETAIVSFRANGNTFEFNASRPVDRESWQLEQQVEVIYLSGNPNEAVLNERGIPGVENTLIKQFYWFVPGVISALAGVLFFLRRK